MVEYTTAAPIVKQLNNQPMYINNKLIQQLAEGTIQVKHTQTDEDQKLINVVLLLAFPDDLQPGVYYPYYYKGRVFHGVALYEGCNHPKKDIKIVELKFFFHPQGHKF